MAHHPVDAAREADAVLLEPVAEPGLRHAHALLELEGEPVQVVEEVGVELARCARRRCPPAATRRSRAQGWPGGCVRPSATRLVGAIGREWNTSSSARITG